ncbi:MAG: hypothetical protein PHX43_03815 [Alphaproteobacteria bacterium]|nr:hypothetical protein [Alphaproteobacteria bacterium]
MLRITAPETEQYDEKSGEFVIFKAQPLQLEHSLVSLSKWESKWKKPFLGKGEKTIEETIDYVKCMNLTQNVAPEVFSRLTTDNLKEIRLYLADSMTATTLPKSHKQVGVKETITSELVYYWMVSLNIPFECQKWHLNRLLMLINVCNVKSSKPKKMSQKELASRNASLNAARRKAMNSGG